MKVAIILSRLVQLGPVTVIQNLVASLKSYEDIELKVYYLDKKVDPAVKMAVKPERLDRKSFRFNDFDIIHTNGIRPDLLAFMNRKKIRYHISTIHNFVFDDLAFTYNRIISLVFGTIWLILWKRADKLVCVSGAMKLYYSKWYPELKLEVIHNGIKDSDNAIVAEASVIQLISDLRSKGLKVIGCAGNLTARKGIDLILRFLAVDKNYSIVIFGDGKVHQSLVNLSEKLNISDRSEFCGFKGNAVVYFKYFDIFIVPSRSEGFGLVLIEAVQQKIPVICSDIAVFKELFNDNEVTYFELGDQRSLTNAIRMATDKGHKKAGLAYAKYLDNYTAAVMAKNYSELYKSA